MANFDLFRIYNDLTKNCPISAIGENINYYYADDLKNNILARQCIELDMTAAFPNICRFLFSRTDPEFINQLMNITVKLEKNIFLTNYLKDKGGKDDRNYLIELTNYAKILTLGYIYNQYDNVNILEFKKDGALFTGELGYIKNNELNEFNNYWNFQYHSSAVNIYSRYNKTSIYKKNDLIEVKGQYKDPPKYLIENILPLLLNNEDVFSNQLISLKSIYSLKFFNILFHTPLFQDIQYYYAFSNNKYITKQNKLEQISFAPKIGESIEPFLVLKQFIYPLLSLLRLEK